MLSIITGMIFTLLITRNTTKEQYGIWSNIFDLMAYFVLLASALPFWATRFVARRQEGAEKTALVANLIIGLIAAAFYIPLVPIIMSMLNISESHIILYFIASLQIIELYMINVLEACLRAKQPQAVGYGLLLEELCKIILAYVLIVIVGQPLLGAMISLVAAVLSQIIYYINLVFNDLKQRIRWEYIKEWLKGSVANIYTLVGNQAAAFIFILLIMYGGAEARGNYQAAATIANIITYSSFLSFALYPKLLAENSIGDITTSLKTVLMFAIPMAAGAIAMPDSFLIILDEPYKEVAPVLSLLAIDALTVTLSNFFTFALFGIEKLDETAKIPLKQLAKSNIFKVFTLPYIHSAITLPTTFYVLTNFAFNQPLQAALYVTMINMTARFAMFLILYTIVRKTVTMTIPWKNIAKYVFASTIMASILFIIPHPTKIHSTLGTTAMGGVIYFALLMAIDKEARSLAYSVWMEIKFKFKGEIKVDIS